ncbi:hypothetical protein ABKV19_025366 [Rosa sericea]
MTSTETDDAVRRRTAIIDYRKRLLQHKELDSRVRAVRDNLRGAKKEFGKTKDDLKSPQSVGQIIGEVLRPLDNERCFVRGLCQMSNLFTYVIIIEKHRVICCKLKTCKSSR